MKKIFLLILGFVMFKVGYSQYPIQQFIGADSAVVTSKGGLQGRFINVVFADTTAANSQRVRQYPGAMIYASGKLWVRNTTATGWNELAYGPITPVNIYNSNGTLTGNRELDGDGNNLTFTAVKKFEFSGDSLYYLLDPAGNLRLKLGNQQFTMQGDTASLSRRISYTGNLGSSFTKQSLVDKNYVDSSITASPSGTVTSVGLSMPTAFAVSNSPVTSSGTLTVTGAGVASQYIRGDGQLATLPTNGGGGSSVSYYLNGSINQGTFGGTTYYEMSKTPVIGTGTDFNISSNGYIASFITDAGDPALLNIPAGNWDFEVYFQSSSASGTPSFYVELYKYNGTTFTLIASSSANPEVITGGTAVDAYYTPLAVPSTSLAITDRLAVRIYVNNSGNTITLHTEDNNLCQIITTFSTGINALNGLTSQVQYFATGTSGSDFNINSATDTHTFNLPTASATNRGALSSANWSTFNSKIGPSDTASMLSNYVTNAGYGLLKTTKTLSVDTLLISTRAWRQKGIDSVASLANSKIGGSGTTNYVSKFTASGTIGNSQIFDNGTSVGIGTATPTGFVNINYSNTDYTNTNGANSHILLSNANAGGQTSVTAVINSAVRAKWRTDVVGNINWVSYANSNTLGHYFYVNGDYGVGKYQAVISNTGTRFGNNLSISAIVYPFEVIGKSSFSDNMMIGTTTDAGFKLDVNGTARINGVLTFGATPTIESFGANTQIKITASTGLTISSDRWNSNTSTSSYILNGYSTKNFITTNSANGSFNSFDFSASNTYFPTIAVSYNQKLINGAMTIQSTAVANFFGLDIRPTDNSSSIANNVYAIYGDATLGTNTAANRWAGYFVGRGYFSGNLGVATTSPTSSLHVVTGNVDGLRVESSNSGYLEVGKTGAGRWRMTNAYSLADVFEILYGAAGAVPTSSRLTIHTTGNTGIATAVDAGYKLDVNGTMRVQGTELRLDNSTTGTINLYSTTPVINFFSGGGYSIGRSGTAMTWNAGGSINFQISSNDAYGVSAANGHVWRTANSGGAALMRLDTGGSLSIGNSSTAAASSSILDLTSTSKGFLPPRMTTAQKNAITSPATGLVIFDTTLNKLCVYTGSAWETVTSL